jgi:hypothetical protein
MNEDTLSVLLNKVTQLTARVQSLELKAEAERTSSALAAAASVGVFDGMSESKLRRTLGLQEPIADDNIFVPVKPEPPFDLGNLPIYDAKRSDDPAKNPDQMLLDPVIAKKCQALATDLRNVADSVARLPACGVAGCMLTYPHTHEKAGERDYGFEAIGGLGLRCSAMLEANEGPGKDIPCFRRPGHTGDHAYPFFDKVISWPADHPACGAKHRCERGQFSLDVHCRLPAGHKARHESKQGHTWANDVSHPTNTHSDMPHVAAGTRLVHWWRGKIDGPFTACGEFVGDSGRGEENMALVTCEACLKLFAATVNPLTPAHARPCQEVNRMTGNPCHEDAGHYGDHRYELVRLDGSIYREGWCNPPNLNMVGATVHPCTPADPSSQKGNCEPTMNPVTVESEGDAQPVKWREFL